MAKAINYTNIIVKINGMRVSTDSTVWRYSEPDEPFESKKVSDWKEIEELLELATHRTHIVRNRKDEIIGIRVYVDFGAEIYKKKNIQTVQVIYEPITREANDFSFEQLQRILPADEFVDWLKDRGITKII